MDKWDASATRAWEAVILQVRALREGGQTLDSIAKLLGVKNRSTISLWLDGQRQAQNTSFPTMLRYLERLGLSYGDFLPPLPTIRRTGAYSPTDKVQGAWLPQIPIMGATGAGDSVELFQAEPEYMLPVLPQYAKEGIIGLVVEGDSMEPTVKRGAVVGIEPFDGRIVEGGIYLIQRPPFGRTIKRIKMGIDNQIILHSDNTAYEPTPLTYDGHENLIIGHVVWIWQSC